MEKQPLLLHFLLLFLLSSCAHNITYLNRNKRISLTLNNDSTYCFKHSDLLGEKKKNGNYKIKNDSIFLLFNNGNRYENASHGVMFDEGKPDSLQLWFRNVYDEEIPVSFTINESHKSFKTNPIGYTSIAFDELHSDSIVSNYVVNNITINYLDHVYLVTNLNYKETEYEIPNGYDFQLSQFIGQKIISEQLKYRYYKDSIIVTGFNPKFYGKYIKLIKQ